jgi:hypothetical protein
MVVAQEEKLTSVRLIEPNCPSAGRGMPARRDGPLEKSGAQIHAETRRAESCAQHKTAKHHDGHERMNVGLGCGNGEHGNV